MTKQEIQEGATIGFNRATNPEGVCMEQGMFGTVVSADDKFLYVALPDPEGEYAVPFNVQGQDLKISFVRVAHSEEKIIFDPTMFLPPTPTELSSLKVSLAVFKQKFG